MEALVEEREARGAFASLDDFAERIDPRLLNRRQIESLAAAGAFDSLAGDRAAVFTAAETILAHAASAADQRESGQHGLFGGESSSGIAPIRLPREANWTLAERMAAEREAFGFYFSAHPVDHHRHLLAAHRVRTYSELGEVEVSEGTRVSAMMAGLIEGVRWRVSARGRRYMMASLSDPSGQFEATVFDDDACADVEAAAKAGGCGLLTVELDRRAGDDQPRVAIRRFQPLERLAKASRLQLEVRLPDAGTGADPCAPAGGGARRQWRRPLRRAHLGQTRSRPARRPRLSPRCGAGVKAGAPGRRRMRHPFRPGTAEAGASRLIQP
jgi:DNA polymerase-3 subunit alpha